MQRMKRVAEVTARLLLGQPNVGQNGSKNGQISYAHVARLSGTSRAWLYEYIGKSRLDLVTLSVRHFAHILGKFEGRTEVTNFEEWRVSQIEDFSEFLNAIVELPHLLQIYFRNKNQNSTLGTVIREFEAKFLLLSAAEIHRALQVDLEKARGIAEYNLATKMGLAHHWVGKPDGFSKADKQQVMQYFALGLNQFKTVSS